MRCERLLLIDSDVELLNGEMLQLMRTLIHRDPCAYGSGYFQRAESLEEQALTRKLSQAVPRVPSRYAWSRPAKGA